MSSGSDDRTADRRSPRIRVLIVEDNHDSRRMLKMLLEFEGFEVLEAADGREGFEILVREQPDAAIIDIRLPEIDGYEVARRARAAGVTRTALVALTGCVLDEDRQRAHEAYFEEHLVKPVPLQVLRSIIDRVARLA